MNGVISTACTGLAPTLHLRSMALDTLSKYARFTVNACAMHLSPVSMRKKQYVSSDSLDAFRSNLPSSTAAFLLSALARYQKRATACCDTVGKKQLALALSVRSPAS